MLLRKIVKSYTIFIYDWIKMKQSCHSGFNNFISSVDINYPEERNTNSAFLWDLQKILSFLTFRKSFDELQKEHILR